jgi:hypothetical protein
LLFSKLWQGRITAAAYCTLSKSTGICSRSSAFGAWQDGVLSGVGGEQLWTRMLELRENGVWVVEVRACGAVGNISTVQQVGLQLSA